MITLLIATRNLHKVDEIRTILGNEFDYLTLSDFPRSPDVIEDAGTFAGNATKKAVAIAKCLSDRVQCPMSNAQRLGEMRSTERAAQKGESASGHPASSPSFVLADDSGLEVDALAGAPGVHSARFAALDIRTPGNSTAFENNAKLLRLLTRVTREQRTARFRCVLALTPVVPVPPDSNSPVCYTDELELQTELFEGICAGVIEFQPRGRNGFGYDPLFVPDGYEQTFGELSEEIKNRLSHRAKALNKLKAWFSARRAT